MAGRDDERVKDDAKRGRSVPIHRDRGSRPGMSHKGPVRKHPPLVFRRAGLAGLPLRKHGKSGGLHVVEGGESSRTSLVTKILL